MSFNPQLADSDGSKHYPQSWPSSFVSPSAGRFAARFRVAKAANVDFDSGISHEISDSYKSFIKLFLAYTAFEIFVKAFSLNRKDREELDLKYGGGELLKKLRTLHANSPSFFCFVEQQLDQRELKKNMTSFINGKDVTVISLAKSLRHIFAHGVLTATSSNSDSAVTKQVGDLIYGHLMKVMDSEAAILANKIKKRCQH